MTWVRLDDTITTHPKMAELGEDEFAAFISALCYCNQHLTDGVLPKNGLKSIRFLTGSRIKKLVKVGLFRLENDTIVIHDYAEYQPTKAQVQAEKEAAKERQRKWRERHRNAVTNASTNGVTNRTHPKPSQEVPPNPLEGGTGKRSTRTNPRALVEDLERAERRTKQLAICRRMWREGLDNGEPRSHLHEALSREFPHDPSIVTETEPPLKETA